MHSLMNQDRPHLLITQPILDALVAAKIPLERLAQVEIFSTYGYQILYNGTAESARKGLEQHGVRVLDVIASGEVIQHIVIHPART